MVKVINAMSLSLVLLLIGNRGDAPLVDGLSTIVANSPLSMKRLPHINVGMSKCLTDSFPGSQRRLKTTAVRATVARDSRNDMIEPIYIEVTADRHQSQRNSNDHGLRIEMESRNDSGDSDGSRRRFIDKLTQLELKLMRLVQGMPGLLPISLGVHYSLLPKVITPSLAMIGWLVSLPAAASLITFVCAQDIINTAIKWSVQRPRPLWHSPNSGLVPKRSIGTWEADSSFPSAHTQFFSGLAFCSWVLSGAKLGANVNLGVLLTFGAIIGITRNYLGVHWPSDTLFGMLLGGTLGLLWGKFDLYAKLLQAGSPLLSLGVATALTGGLVLLLHLVRTFVPAVDDKTRDQWYSNAMAHLAFTQEDLDTMSPEKMLRPRLIRSKIHTLTTVWCALAITALCPAHLPSAMNEPAGCAACRLLQATVGIGGLGGVQVLIKKMLNRMPRVAAAEGLALSLEAKAALKGLAYAGICSWTFILSQLASHRLLSIFTAG